MDFEKEVRRVLDVVNGFWRTDRKNLECKAFEETKWSEALKAAYIAGMEDVVEEYCDSEVSDFLASILQRIKELKGETK